MLNYYLNTLDFIEILTLLRFKYVFIFFICESMEFIHIKVICN